MVCFVGSGRMAVMARLLEAGRFLPNGADEVSHHKLAAQNIYREFCQADEANLLDEEDMHVFGLRPMADPLHLVCCNACKKPVKASQYAAHAELCRSLNAAGEPMLDVYSGTGNRKPPRKERKKLLSAYANQATPVVEQERSESTDDDSSSLTMDIKRNFASVDTASVLVASRVSTENTDHSACVMPPPAKRSKISCRIVDECLPLAGDPESSYCVTNVTNAQGLHACRDSQEQITPRSDISNDNICKGPGQVHEQCMQVLDFPVPLATKIYYSQRNNRLKSALTHLYHEASSNEQGKDVVIPQALHPSTLSLEASAQGGSSQEEVVDVINRKSVQTPDQILAQNSEVFLSKSEGCLQATNFSNQFQVDNVLRSQNTSVGLTRSKYLSKAYPFTGNTGKLLGNMQQPNGSVPVV